MTVVSPLTALLNTAVRKASNSLSRDFSEIEKLQSSIKDYKAFVVNAYGKIDRAIRMELAKVKPDVPFYEEGKPTPDSPHFVVSPLDGLSNFAHGIPHFAISVAVCDKVGIIAATVYNPVSDELFFAEKGKGAYKEGTRNSERLRVSGRKEIKEALVATLVSYKKDANDYQKIHDSLVKETDNVRVFGSASLDLAYVASGRLDAAVSLNNKINEIAAGVLLVKEAGGYIYDVYQKDINTNDLKEVLASGNILAVNANLNKRLYELLK